MREHLSMAQLRALARTLPLEEFEQRVGPYGLIRVPSIAPEERVGPAVGQSTIISSSADIIARTMTLMLGMEELPVASMPRLDADAELTVGRLPDRCVFIDDASVSKWHAVLRWDPAAGRCCIEDTGSTNGTFVNASKLQGSEAMLEDGDIVSFGEVPFWYVVAQTLHAKLLATKADAGQQAVPSSQTPIATVALKSVPAQLGDSGPPVAYEPTSTRPPRGHRR